MGSTTPTLAPVTGGNTEQSRTTAAVLIDLIFALLLIGLSSYGALYLFASRSGERRPLLLALFVGALLPIGPLIVLSAIERLFPPAGPRKSFRSWFLHLQINVLLLLMLAVANGIGLLGLSALAKHWGFKLGLIDLQFAHGKGLIFVLGATWLAAIIGDFFFYWFHLALHKSKVLWQHHKMHHMDRELEAVTVARQNWIEAFMQLVSITIPVAIFFKIDDLDPWNLGLLAALSTLVFQTLISLGHVNVRLQAGRASIIFCTPQMHRIHHSRLPEHQDKNFAFIFPFWDVLFGTYYAPGWNEFPPSGVDGEKEIESFWESQIFTQREWWRMFRRWRNSRLARLA